jgi:hypothetical protein
MININLQLEIMPGNKIKVSGAETIISLKLSNSLTRQGINYILKAALKAMS